MTFLAFVGIIRSEEIDISSEDGIWEKFSSNSRNESGGFSDIQRWQDFWRKKKEKHTDFGVLFFGVEPEGIEPSS